MLAAAPASQAAQVDITWTGAASGTDTLGLFGAPGGVLAGAAYTAIFRYDTSINFQSTAFSQAVQGGTFHGNASPAISASLTINGNTVNALTLYSATYQHTNTGANSLISTEVQGQNAINLGAIDILFNRVQRLDGLFPLGLDTPFSRTFGVGDKADGFFQRFNSFASAFMQITLSPETSTFHQNGNN